MNGSDSARHFLERDTFSFVANKLLIGLRGREDGIEVLVAGSVDKTRRDPVRSSPVHLIGEFSERDIAISVRKALDQFRQRLFK